MESPKVFNKKKIINVLVTFVEIAVVAAIIMGGLMFIRSKLTGQSFGIGKVEINNNNQQSDVAKKEKEAKFHYYIQVNLKKNVVIVYKQNKKKTKQEAVKVMKASIGSKVKKGKYSLLESYEWRNTTSDIWNKYNFRYNGNGWIQSADYNDKYSWTLKASSYKKIGKSQSENKNIKLYAKDAAWIFNNCGTGTVVEVIKGKKEDVLPLEIEKSKALYAKCGWDPTDPQKGNPYKKVSNGTVSAYEKYVYVEKGDSVDYYANLIALSSDGKDITENLNYDTIDTSSVGKKEVTYKFKNKKGMEYKATVKYKVVDTTPPVIKLSKDELEYEMEDVSDKKIQTSKVKKALEELVDDACSANEGKIVVTAFPKEELKKGINYVSVVATDDYGNIGSMQVPVKIVKKKVEKKKTTKKTTQNKNQKTNKKENNKNTKTEKTTTASKNNKKTKEKETTKSEKTTKQSETKTSETKSEETSVNNSGE
ncbi:MAG: murein L,D-transpeptidase [Lachnospiraceae bacterium]|nr:murein L,D-transpeptidase [Lachnospiraceae bacterium]